MEYLELIAFSDELEKQAIALNVKALARPAAYLGSKFRHGVGGLVKNIPAAAERMVHPVKGFKKGYKMMSPRGQLANMTSSARAAALKKGFKAPHLAKHLDKPLSLAEAASGKNGSRAKGLAEELSRRGWTGKGKLTKYVPVGEKGMTTGFAATTIPSIAKARMEGGERGEGGKMERGGAELMGLGASVASTGLGFLPGAGMMYLASRAGKKLGRTADRMQRGASAKDAWSAVSPSEARAQIEAINKYHGR